MKMNKWQIKTCVFQYWSLFVFAGMRVHQLKLREEKKKKKWKKWFLTNLPWRNPRRMDKKWKKHIHRDKWACDWKHSNVNVNTNCAFSSVSWSNGASSAASTSLKIQWDKKNSQVKIDGMFIIQYLHGWCAWEQDSDDVLRFGAAVGETDEGQENCAPPLPHVLLIHTVKKKDLFQHILRLLRGADSSSTCPHDLLFLQTDWSVCPHNKLVIVKKTLTFVTLIFFTDIFFWAVLLWSCALKFPFAWCWFVSCWSHVCPVLCCMSAWLSVTILSLVLPININCCHLILRHYWPLLDYSNSSLLSKTNSLTASVWCDDSFVIYIT